MFNESQVLPGCWPDSHIGFMSITSSPFLLDSCSGSSPNILQYVRLLRDSPSNPSLGGMNIQVVTRSESSPAPMKQSMTATCARTGGCDLEMKWASNVCSSGNVTVSFSFADGSPSITQTWYFLFTSF
jgi:hypothetical protein